MNFGVIPPGDHVANVIFLRVEGDRAKLDYSELVNRGLRFRVSFTDTEGRTWFRDQRGRLKAHATKTTCRVRRGHRGAGQYVAAMLLRARRSGAVEW